MGQELKGSGYFKSARFKELSEQLHGQRFAIYYGLRHRYFSPSQVDLKKIIEWGFGYSKLGKDDKPNPDRREVLHNFLIDYLETLIIREVNRGTIVKTFRIILENDMMNANQFKAFFFGLNTQSLSIKDELFDVYHDWITRKNK